MKTNIKDVTYGEPLQIGGDPIMGHPHFPQKTYPGYGVDYPTCSAPTAENRGCDAFKKCTTPGEGPYMVAFRNKSGRKDFSHCRNWMYKLQFKHGYTALGKDPEDSWEDQVGEELIDPDDKGKGTRTVRQKAKVENVRYPRPFREHPDERRQPEIKDIEVSYNPPGTDFQEGIEYGNRRAEDQGPEAGHEGSVGSEGNRKGRGRTRGTDEGRG